MPTITIKNLLVEARHGVLEQERRVGNTFRVSLSVEVPSAARAMDTDSLDDTVNYAEMAALIRSSMSRPRALIEAAAGDIVRELKARFGSRISHGAITIEKLAPPIPAQMESVGFTAEF